MRQRASSSAQPADSADVASRVGMAQMDTLARLSPGSAMVGTVAAGALTAMFWSVSSHLYLVVWMTLMVATYGSSVARSVAWQSRTRPAVVPKSAMQSRIMLTALLGVLWGSMPIALIPLADTDDRQIVGYVCAGLIAAGPALAPVLPAALMFSGFIVLGTLTSLLLEHDRTGYLMTPIVVGYAGMMTVSIFDLHRRFTERVLANVQLEEQREIIGLLLRDFEESSSDWLWQTDAAGRLSGGSAHLATAVDRLRNDVEGLAWSSWIADGAMLNGPAREGFRRLSDALAQPVAFRDLVLPRVVGGEERWLSLTGKPVYGRDGVFRGFRGVGADVTAARVSAARISYLASTDNLTDLPNRTTLAEVLATACAAGAPFALLYLDLDEFKSVNDTLGHSAGDTLLVAAAGRMRHCLRAGDVLARLGGDEFAVVQAAGDAASAETLARRLTERLADSFAIDTVQLVVGASVGIALAPADGATPEILCKAADLALYRAKNDGRGTWRFYEPGMSVQVELRSALQADLRQAQLRNELAVHYQPICDLQSGKVVTMEALLRWQHAARGAVSPAEFIPLAEEGGLIVAIGAWVLREACSAAVDWQTPVRIAVNLSPLQVRDPGLLGIVDGVLSETGLPAERLELEITESLFLEATEATRACLHALRSRGIRIALDDFGTGYSSLSYLRSFPFDKVKIDRSFVVDIAEDKNAAAIVRAITGMADSLGMITTAEGVETCAQRDVLRAQGCTQAQGFLYSRALPQEGAARLLAFGGSMQLHTASALVDVG